MMSHSAPTSQQRTVYTLVGWANVLLISFISRCDFCFVVLFSFENLVSESYEDFNKFKKKWNCSQNHTHTHILTSLLLFKKKTRNSHKSTKTQTAFVVNEIKKKLCGKSISSISFHNFCSGWILKQGKNDCEMIFPKRSIIKWTHKKSRISILFIKKTQRSPTMEGTCIQYEMVTHTHNDKQTDRKRKRDGEKRFTR